MINYRIYLVGFLLISANTYADCYITVGKGHTSGNVTFQEIRNGGTTRSKMDQSGSAESFSVGCPVSKEISFSIDYLELSENFKLLETKSGFESKSYGVSTSWDFYQSEKFDIGVGAGYGKWKSKTQMLQAWWDFSSSPMTLFFENKYYSNEGYTPYANFDLSYSLNESLSLGIQYAYYHKIGYVEPIIDFDALAIADIPGTLKAGSQKFTSVELYFIHLKWSF